MHGAVAGSVVTGGRSVSVREVRVQGGTNPWGRRFKYKGSWGYVDTGLFFQFVGHYVRARHYSGAQGMWTSVDPLWPGEKAYGYVGNRVSVRVDPSGRQGGMTIGILSQKTKTHPLRKYLFKRFKDCGFSGNDLRTITSVFFCIAVGESSLHPNIQAAGVKEAAKGLYQLGDEQFLRTKSWRCSQSTACNVFDVECNAEAAIRLFVTLCNDFKLTSGDATDVYSATARY